MKSYRKSIFSRFLILSATLLLIISQIMILSYVAAYDGGQSNTANNESYDTKSDKQASLPEITSDSSVTDEQALMASSSADSFLTEENDFERTSENGCEYLKSKAYNLQIEVSGSSMIVNVLDWSLSESRIPDISPDGYNPLHEFSDIKSLTVSLGVVSVGDNAFKNFSKLESIILEDGVEEIGNGSFSGCVSLSRLSVPSTLGKTGDNAFSGCDRIIDLKDNTADANLSGGLLDKGIVSSCLNLFRDGTANGFLTRMTVDADNSSFEFAIKESTYYLIGCQSSEAHIILPDNIDGNRYSIYRHALTGCETAEKITVPDSVVQIYDNAFFGCSTLKSIEVKGNPQVGDSVFGGIESKISVICPSDSEISGKCDGEQFVYEAPAEENKLKISYAGEDYLVSNDMYKVRFIASLNTSEAECAGFSVYAYVLDRETGEYKMINSAVVGKKTFSTEIRSLADENVILKTSNDSEACFISLLIDNIPVDGEYDFCLTPIAEDKNHEIIYGQTTHIYIINESGDRLNIMRDDSQTDNPDLPTPEQILALKGENK